jgi:hypothetical protein
MATIDLGGLDELTLIQLHELPGGDAAHHRAVEEALRVVVEVLPHEELGEGRETKVGVLQDLPPRNPLDRAAKAPDELGDVHAAVGTVGAFHREGLQLTGLDAEVPPELLEQRDVEERLLGEPSEASPADARVEGQLYGVQQQRSEERLLRRAALEPLQEPDCQVEDGGAALLEGRSGLAVEVLQAGPELIRTMSCMDRPSLQVRHPLRGGRLLHAPLGQRGVPRIGGARDGARQEVEGLTSEDPVLQQLEIRHMELEGALPLGLEVQEPVSKREIEQSLLPAPEAVPRVGRGRRRRSDHLRRREAGRQGEEPGGRRLLRGLGPGLLHQGRAEGACR